MLLKPRARWFLAFTAVFAAMATFVFWGTWSVDVSPVMPDALINHPSDHLSRFISQFLATGKFIPGDIIEFLGPTQFWQELQYVLAVYFAALGLVYYGRGRGISRLAAYGAALLLAFCGYWFSLFSAGHLGWFRWMTYGVFAFGLCDRAVRKGELKYWLLLGADVAWASFNQQDLWLLFTVFTAAYFGWCCWRERRLPWKGVLIAAAVFAAVGLPNFIDTLGTTLQNRKTQLARGENVTNKDKAEIEQRWEFVTNWSMPPEGTLEWIIPGVHGDTSCPFVLSLSERYKRGVTPYTGRLGRPMNATAGNYRQHSLYVGWAICLFALCGLAARFLRKPEVEGCRPPGADILFFTLAAVVFYLLSLGRFFEMAYRIIFWLPFGDLIRCPVKWHHLTELSLCVLAAYGIDYLSAVLSRVSFALRGLLIAVILLGVIDLARVDRRYCMPVDIRAAKARDMKEELTILGRSDFKNPQIAQMVKAGYIFSLANYLGSPDHFVVAVLSPFEKEKRPFAALPFSLGLISLFTTLMVGIYGVKKS